ncbi:hypothetical protein CHS0354_040499 [Potamilus streckersoni]|uniref:Uncharacterized protein n=1 Tax=Potamilus streckersoni TaxID=2493646 RepID=A0AAE0TJV2_9BIVA|nr:hypothetical protein CHS0354_040499 [Potamilus streckersoni]
MAMATIEEELTCPVCLDFYKDPRLLSCQHSLCKSCIVALCSNKGNAVDCVLECPTCRHVFQAKDETCIESFPKNFGLASIVYNFQESMKVNKGFPCDLCKKERAIKKCLQCQSNYCRMCLEQKHPKAEVQVNHMFVQILGSNGDEREHEEYSQTKKVRYCMSCDEICVKGDKYSKYGSHEYHDTTDLQSALRQRKEEFECILGRLKEENKDLEKGVADISSKIETIQKKVEEKMTLLVQRYLQVTKEMEQRKMSAEHRMKEEMKMRITSLEGHLHELKDLKKKTELRLSAFSKLSHFASDDAIIFLMKLKELQIEIGPVTGDYVKRRTILTDSSLPVEKLMDEIIANAIRPSERRLQIPGTKPTNTDILPKHVEMAVQVTNVQKAGMMLADVEWSRIKQAGTKPTNTDILPKHVEMAVQVTNVQKAGMMSADVEWSRIKQAGTKPTNTDILPKHVEMAVKVINVQKAGVMSADVEWSRIKQAGQYEVSYSCSPNETVVLKKIAENRCKLTNLRWDSTYTIKVTTQLQDGSTVFDEGSFKTDPQVKCTKPTNTDILPKHVEMAVQVTNVQKAGMMSADVEWSRIKQAGQYEVSYSCSPNETVVLKKIAENRCKLTNLRWDSTFTIKVTTQLQDGSTVFDEGSFKTDPQVKCTKPTNTDILPKHVEMAVQVTNVQKAGMMSADVEWSRIKQAGQYEVSYSCSPNETVVLKKIAENRCKLTNLRWDSTFTIKVTTQLQDGSTVFDEGSFKTDPQVKFLQMAVSKICTEKVLLLYSFNGFKASNMVYNWSYFRKEGEFSGIIVTPLLTEDRSFWTMEVGLSIFEAGEMKDVYLDFGIINYSNLKDNKCLTNNKMAYSCTVHGKKKRKKTKFHLEFTNRLITEVPSYPLPLTICETSIFCIGFLYDSVNCQFAVMDCQTQKVLHVFHDVIFVNDDTPVFAIYSSHTARKMRVKIKFDYIHCTNEDISCWMQKIDEF